MSRPLRIEFPGATWHVTSRGVEKRNIFLSNRDRREFTDLLGRVVAAHRWKLYAYVLMSNHYHLLIMTREPNLSAGMQKLGALYAQRFNEKHVRWGHLFGGRFKSHMIDTSRYLLSASRYIVLNPVRAGLSITADEWPWSSYPATAGATTAPPWLAVDELLRQFHPAGRELAAAHYREFVAAGAAENVGVRPLYGT
jgi:putative transposase